MLKNSLKFISIGALAIVAVVGFVLFQNNPTLVKAATALIYDSLNKNLASTTLNYNHPFATSTTFFLVPGTVQATSTLTLYTLTADQVALNVVFSASSTASVLRWRYEYSSNNIDWYSDSVAVNANATTSVIADPADFSMAYASSTAGKSTANANFFHTNLFNIASPYTRVVFFANPASTGVGVSVNAVIKANNAI